MEVEDVDAVSSKLSQTLIERGQNAVRLVHTGLVRVALGSQSQATFLPASIFGPGFLLSTHVSASRVNLIIALRLQVVQSLVVVGEISLTSTRVGVGTLSILGQYNREV